MFLTTDDAAAAQNLACQMAQTDVLKWLTTSSNSNQPRQDVMHPSFRMGTAHNICLFSLSTFNKKAGKPTTGPMLGMLIFPNLGEGVPLWW